MQIDRRKIEICMAENGLCRRDLTKPGGIPESTLGKLLSNGGGNPKTVGKLASALGVPVTDIIKED